jgi:hypothetical protein
MHYGKIMKVCEHYRYKYIYHILQKTVDNAVFYAIIKH